MKGITFKETLDMLMKMNKIGGETGKAGKTLREAFRKLARPGSSRAMDILNRLGIKCKK